ISCFAAISLLLLFLLHLLLLVVLDAQVHVHRERVQRVLLGLAVAHRFLEQLLRVVGRLSVQFRGESLPARLDGLDVRVLVLAQHLSWRAATRPWSWAPRSRADSTPASSS